MMGGRSGGTATTRGGATEGGAMTGRRSGGAATTRGGAPGGGAMMGGRSGGAAITGGARTGGTAFGTRPSNWNRYPRQFDTNVYQRNYSASRQFHWRSYNRPNGWYYQRWGFGQIFPRIFWAQNYWLSDYWMFDLPIPPYGYVWVRYGDDAVLINRRSGRILQVVYGVFY
jgi:Ni/Co efflux regulator RcnB